VLVLDSFIAAGRRDEGELGWLVSSSLRAGARLAAIHAHGNYHGYCAQFQDGHPTDASWRSQIPLLWTALLAQAR